MPKPTTKMVTIGGWQFFEHYVFCDEAHFTLGGYVSKQNCCIRGPVNHQLIENRPLHPEKVSVWCAVWSEGVIGWDIGQYISKSGRKWPQKNQCLQHFAWRSLKLCNVSNIMSTFKLYNKIEISWKNIFYMCFIYVLKYAVDAAPLIYFYVFKCRIKHFNTNIDIS